MDHVTLERFEDNGWAVVERPDGETFNVPRSWVPGSAQEGAVLRLELNTDAESVQVALSIDHEETERRREEAQAWYDATPKVGEGDLEL